MKAYFALLVLTAALLASSAYAQTTINLPLPTIAKLNPSIPTTCSAAYYKTPFTIVTGFDSTGNYVLGTADNVYVCGHSGRGSNLHYYPYCANFVWDLAGNLVQTIVGTCSQADAGQSYVNAGGYEAYTFVVVYYGYLQYEYPVLVTP